MCFPPERACAGGHARLCRPQTPPPADNQLEMTTKRTIMENEQMSIELHYQSRQTEKLMNKNMVLLEENQDLRQQLALSKQTQEELARRNNVYQKTIKSLVSR